MDLCNSCTAPSLKYATTWLHIGSLAFVCTLVFVTAGSQIFWPCPLKASCMHECLDKLKHDTERYRTFNMPWSSENFWLKYLMASFLRISETIMGQNPYIIGFIGLFCGKYRVNITFTQIQDKYRTKVSPVRFIGAWGRPDTPLL